MIARRLTLAAVVSLCVVSGALAFAAAPALAAAPEAPETKPAESITATTATLNGVLNPAAPGEPGTYEFLYKASETECTEGSTAPNPAEVALGAEKEVVSAGLTGLQPNTKYTFCLLARNAGEETAIGVPVTFTTLTAPPTITSESVANVESTAATLRAKINPGGAETTYHFDYGTTAAYGQSTPESASIGADNTEHAAAVTISALQPGTAYHYRLVATNSQSPAGGTTGPDKLLTTHVVLGSEPPESCPNAQFRTSYSAYLPDCRAYELVSPQGIEPFFRKNGVSENYNAGQAAAGETFGIQASVGGSAIGIFSPYAPTGYTNNGPYYKLARQAGGWTTESIVPPQSTTNTGRICYNAYTPAYTPELTKWVLADGWAQSESLGCGHDEPLLLAGEPQGYQNLFLYDSEAASYQLVNVTPASVTPRNAWFQAASTDLSHVVFVEDDEAPLTPEAPVGKDIEPERPSGENLYEWSDGVVRLVTILPNGTSVLGLLADGDYPGNRYYSGAELYTYSVSADGSRVFFTAQGNLYVRKNADQKQSALNGEGKCTEPAAACTAQVDASQAGGSGGGGAFGWASADGAQVFFTDGDSAGLTADTVPGSGQNLYRYEVATGKLTDLTASPDARVLGMSGVSEDGSYAYFVAEGALTATPNSVGRSASAGEPNLYLSHGGTTTFIATLRTSADQLDWEPTHELTARVSPNGLYIGFNSVNSLTGYDNVPASPLACNRSTPESCQEIYLYSAAQNELSCASCDPSGSLPTSAAHINGPIIDLVSGSGEWAAPMYPQRNVSDNGQVFFYTPDGLLAQDTNGQSDVYEYQGGRLNLISGGTSGTPSYFLDASVSGDDVFFLTGQAVLPYSTSTQRVYDARVDGGFPEPPGSPTACGEEDCKGAVSAAPSFSAPTSATFLGIGNLVAAPPVHKASKSVAKKHTKKHKKRRPKKKGRKSSRSKRSSRNRGGIK